MGLLRFREPDGQGDQPREGLISQDNVDIIVGGGNMSGLALAISPMAEKAGMPFISVDGATQIVAPIADHRFGFKAMVDDDRVIARTPRSRERCPAASSRCSRSVAR